MHWTNIHQISGLVENVIADDRSDLHFSVAQGTLSWLPILGGKSAKVGIHLSAHWRSFSALRVLDDELHYITVLTYLITYLFCW